MTEVLLGVAIVVTLLNLVLLLGVVRRLREHETRLASMTGGGPPVLITPAGGRVAPFSARSVDGRSVDEHSTDAALVGFFSPECGSCHERLPDFRAAAGEHAGPVLAVVVEDGGDTSPLVDALRTCATVVLEAPTGPVAEAFAVRGFPAFALVADGTVAASGYELPLHTA